MTNPTQPEAMDLADWLEAVFSGPSAKRCAALLREQHARIAELEAKIEALSAAPAGWKLVPVEPDISMQIAAKRQTWIIHHCLIGWSVTGPNFCTSGTKCLQHHPHPQQSSKPRQAQC